MSNPSLTARQAKDILENDVFNLVMEKIENVYLEKWRTSKLEDTEARETCFMMLQATAEFKRLVRIELEKATMELAKQARERGTRNPRVNK